MRKKLTTKEFIDKSEVKHGNLYDYSKVIYTRSTNKVIIGCPIHGYFYQLANSHLQGFGCPKCGYQKAVKSKTMPLTQFIEKAKLRHNDKYDYSSVYYKHSEIKVSIICPIHGVFKQKPTHHLQGRGCPKCKTNGFTLTGFINNCKNNPNSDPKVYIINCFNNVEEFIKIGLISDTVFNRFKYSRLPYEYKIIKEIKGSPEFIYKLEKSLHRKYEKFKYKPLISFCGETECFNISILSEIEKE